MLTRAKPDAAQLPKRFYKTAEPGPVDGGFGVMVDTANGTVMEDRGTADRLVIGPIARAGFAVHISRGEDDLNVIGMNFLSTLSAWSVEGNTLLLKA